MIDERELMEWIETHKILSKTDSIGSDGKYYYGIRFVDLRREIQRLSGTRWIGGDKDGKETEIGQQEVFLQRADNDDA